MASKPQTRHLTPRDMHCLTWIGLQYAIRFDQLRHLLYRHTPEADRWKLKPGTNALSIDRTYEIIEKWHEMGLVEKKIIYHHDKLWIWLSRHGLREMGLEFNYSGEPKKVEHLYHINQVRLFIEEKRPADPWFSERQILHERGIQGETHRPDAILINHETGRRTAIEVELNEKTSKALLDDLRALAATYRSVWYFATQATRRQVEVALEDFSLEMRKPFTLYALEDYSHEYTLSPISADA